jgi:hypothetical protein
MRILGENCVEASVSVISRIAKTIETPVIVEVAMLVRMACATWGATCEGNSACGTNQRIAGNCSSKADMAAPAVPSARTNEQWVDQKSASERVQGRGNRTGSRFSISTILGRAGALSSGPVTTAIARTVRRDSGACPRKRRLRRFDAWDKEKERPRRRRASASIT